jgi:signal transduction histidine kinase
MNLFAQTTQSAKNVVAVTGNSRTEIELAVTKMEKIQAQAEGAQTSLKLTITQLKAEYTEAQAELNHAVEKARKELKVPDTATFNQATYSFNLPEKKSTETQQPKK